MKQSIIAVGFLAMASGAFAADKPVLTVLANDTFAADWGPGPLVEQAFEEVCGCDLRFKIAADSAALLARLRLEGARTDVDIVLGLDTNLTAAAVDSGLFAEHGQGGVKFDLPIDWNDPYFLPFDWGYIAFIYDSKTISNPPKTMLELAASDLKIVIQDPRSSITGLSLLLWTQIVHTDQASIVWADLSDNIVTVTKGWTEAYGMFLEGEADMVLSYTTSPAYHLIAESDDTKAAALFEEGHYMQIEVAGKVAGSEQDDLANQFLAFMVSEPFQSIIPTTNWMYPAVIPANGLPDGFETLIIPEKSLHYSAEQAVVAREEALETWLNVLSR